MLLNRYTTFEARIRSRTADAVPKSHTYPAAEGAEQRAVGVFAIWSRRPVKMKKSGAALFASLALALVCILAVVGCGKQEPIVGTWEAPSGNLEQYDDGTFTYANSSVTARLANSACSKELGRKTRTYPKPLKQMARHGPSTLSTKRPGRPPATASVATNTNTTTNTATITSS